MVTIASEVQSHKQGIVSYGKQLLLNIMQQQQQCATATVTVITMIVTATTTCTTKTFCISVNDLR